MPRVSIVTAFLNEQANLPEFRRRVTETAEKHDFELEVVLIDDHSTDNSPTVAKAWAREDGRVKYLRLSRNCGAHTAVTAGIRYATGDCVVILASDLQDPPESIPMLLDRWRQGFDVVWAVREAREGESWSTKLFSAVYYRIMRRVALSNMPAKGADFLLFDRKVADAFNRISEKNTNVQAMILWMGFRQTSLEYVKQARHEGRSKWTLSKKLKLFVDSIVSFSYVPIRLMSSIGIVTSMLGLLYALIVVTNAALGEPVAGWTSLMVVVLILGGLQLTMLGVLGEYVWRGFDEARGRPRFIIEDFCSVAEASARTNGRLDSLPPADGTYSPDEARVQFEKSR
jgi:glycosyltransferase involved in cell wall biosynthesis